MAKEKRAENGKKKIAPAPVEVAPEVLSRRRKHIREALPRR